MNPITTNLPRQTDEQIAHWLDHNVRKRFHEREPLTAQDMMLLDMQISICTELLARRQTPLETDAIALLRELNDALKIPGWLQPRVDAVLDGHETVTDTRWIPMKERQPADFERVLCVNSAGYMTTANRFHDTKLDCWNGSDYTAEDSQELVIGGITHWMKLPDMPLPQREKL